MSEPILELCELRMSYGDLEVLKGIDLRVYPGQIIGYIGPNGAGKSTTVKIILGLLENYTGQVKVFGRDIAEDRVAYKARIGYVPETGDIYDSLTAAEYLHFIGDLYALPEDVISARAEAMARLLGLEESYHSRISSFSRGMRQKVLIIASLIHDPDILFLDEPLTGLDANSVMIFREIIEGLARRGKTIFYSSHIMEVVEKLSDRILLLHNGIIVADGSFEELQKVSLDDSLHTIFNRLTGFTSHKEIASEFLAALGR
jgi:ABC-2 type transport system ATP-binding protein